MPISRRELLVGAATVALAACSPRPRSALTPKPEQTTGGPTAGGPTAGGPTTGGPTTGGPTTGGPIAAGPSATPPPDEATTAGATGPARFVRSGPVSSAAVALTFHGSGDVVLVRALLEQARVLSVPITVFAVGRWLVDNPGIASSIVDGGHELANHTYTHPALGQLGRPDVATEITRCRDALSAEAGQPGRWFRPSGIDVPTQLMLEEAGRAGYPTVVGYDVDPRDFEDPPADLVAERVASGIHPGAIVSLHTGHIGTVTAFAPIVASIRAAGLTPVLVRDLLAG